MQRKLQIASVVVPLEAGQSIDVDFPDGITVEDPGVSVSRYNQLQVEILFYEEYATVSVQEMLEARAHDQAAADAAAEDFEEHTSITEGQALGLGDGS